jgi:16S rRNA G1207 methylase RsmC
MTVAKGARRALGKTWARAISRHVGRDTEAHRVAVALAKRGREDDRQRLMALVDALPADQQARLVAATNTAVDRFADQADRTVTAAHEAHAAQKGIASDG